MVRAADGLMFVLREEALERHQCLTQRFTLKLAFSDYGAVDSANAKSFFADTNKQCLEREVVAKPVIWVADIHISMILRLICRV